MDTWAGGHTAAHREAQQSMHQPSSMPHTGNAQTGCKTEVPSDTCTWWRASAQWRMPPTMCHGVWVMTEGLWDEVKMNTSVLSTLSHTSRFWDGSTCEQHRNLPRAPTPCSRQHKDLIWTWPLTHGGCDGTLCGSVHQPLLVKLHPRDVQKHLQFLFNRGRPKHLLHWGFGHLHHFVSTIQIQNHISDYISGQVRFSGLAMLFVSDTSSEWLQRGQRNRKMGYKCINKTWETQGMGLFAHSFVT